MMTRGFSEQTSYNRFNGKARLTAVVLLSANNTPQVSVDLIGEKNQVILELFIVTVIHRMPSTDQNYHRGAKQQNYTSRVFC